MVKISQKVLLALLLSSNSFAQDCRPSIYKLGNDNLCFSSKHRTYLSQSCADDKCGALEIAEKAKTFDRSKLPPSDSRHPGAQACAALGGKTTVVTSDKTQDQLCMCVAEDQSAVTCARLGLR